MKIWTKFEQWNKSPIDYYARKDFHIRKSIKSMKNAFLMHIEALRCFIIDKLYHISKMIIRQIER